MKLKLALIVGTLLILLTLPSTMVTGLDSLALGDSPTFEPIATSVQAESGDHFDPSKNIDFQAAYDSTADRVIMYGGWNETPNYATGETWSYDLETNKFVNMAPDMSPSPRFLGSMAYDSQSDKTVLFGGYNGQVPDFSFDETWIYDYSTNNWTQATAATSPSYRYGFQLAYDSESDVIIFYGGNEQGGRGFVDDTWAYDVDTDTWVEMNPTISPSPRMDFAMEYDSLNDRIILVSGYPLSGVTSETWSYDYNTDTWTELSPAYGPTSRSNPSMAYDSESQVMVLFGGNTGTEPLDDVWHYDYGTNSWTHFANPLIAPIVRHRHELVYDLQSDRIISIGGGLGPRLGASAGLVEDSLWVYNTNINHWRQMDSSFPKGLGDPLVTYDSDADRVFIHGGWITTTVGDTWSYDYDTDSFHNVAPYPTAPTRQVSAMEYDAQSKKTVMFSGLEMWPDGDYPDDTWIYDSTFNNWTEVFPASSPSGRAGHRMAYDSESDRIIMFGGRAPDGITGLVDTWSYDLDTNNWTQMSPAISPVARWYHSMTYDRESDRVILFGGWSFPPVAMTHSDTWAYDYNTDTWEEMTPALSPPARYLHSISYDNESDRTVLFGGYDQSDFSDTWTYNYNTNTWTESTANPHPSARQRHETVYDSESDRVILFGGISSPYPFQTDAEDFPQDSCWTFDVNTDSWTLMDLNTGFVDESTDSDSDDLPDVQEFILGTDANNPDSDFDLMWDGWEYDNGLNPLLDDSLDDPDDDDLTNVGEFLNDANPFVSDTDSDSIPDGLEVHTYGTLPYKADSDDDLIPDLYEVNNGLNAMVNDTYDDLDSDGLTNFEEFQLGTSADDADTDSDLASDSWEVFYSFDPLDGSDGSLDTDSDGLLNYEEEAYGTNPRDADTDHDGYSDLWETSNNFSPVDAHVSFLQLVVANVGFIAVGVVGLVAFVVGYRYILFKEVRGLKQQLLDEQEARRKAVEDLANHAKNGNSVVEDTTSREEA